MRLGQWPHRHDRLPRRQPGTSLGAHSVVGANAVVRGDFAAGSVIAGIPGRVISRHADASGSGVSGEDFQVAAELASAAGLEAASRRA